MVYNPPLRFLAPIYDMPNGMTTDHRFVLFKTATKSILNSSYHPTSHKAWR